MICFLLSAGMKAFLALLLYCSQNSTCWDGQLDQNPFISKGAMLNIKLDISGIFSIVIHISWYVKCLSTHQSFGTLGPLKFVDLWDPILCNHGSWGWSLVVSAHAVKAGSTLVYMCYSLSKINEVPKPLLNNTSVKGFGTGLFLVLRCHDDVMATSPLVKTCQVNWRSLRFLVNGHVLAQRTTVSSSLSRRGVRLCWGTRWSGG